MIDLSAIKGLSIDSRTVQKNYLFAAIKGEAHDGHAFIDQAIKSGATAILSEQSIPVPDHVQLILSKNPAQDIAKIAAQYYGSFPDNIVAVTGTNGKSSVVHFVQQLWEACGLKAASIGTLTGGLTSPDAITLSQTLAKMHQDGISHVAIEASSHGLQQYRLDGLHIKAAGFTNLSHDHLDYHATMDDYLQAKLRLFKDLLPKDGVIVANADAPEITIIKDSAKASIQTYGIKGDAQTIKTITPTQNGQQLTLTANGQNHDVTIPLVGEFQIHNALCALGLSLMGAPPTDADIAALSTLRPAKGRLQPITGHPSGAAIYIDYAHTPDALETILKSLRPHVKGLLFCVFGCGGDRDKSKRPAMGRIASDLADVTIITDDNPRHEKPVDIRREILAGIPQIKHNKTVFEISDRFTAIDHSIKKLQKGDVLVIAGKGHESGQIIKNQILPFDDHQEACRVIENLVK